MAAGLLRWLEFFIWKSSLGVMTFWRICIFCRGNMFDIELQAEADPSLSSHLAF